MNICTSFSPVGFKQYGTCFVTSYEDNDWPFCLYLFNDGSEPSVGGDFDNDYNTRHRDLTEDKEAEEFKERFHKIESGDNYRQQAIKFSRKVFAMSNMLEVTGWFVWFDADIVFTGPPTVDFIKLMNNDTSLIYLGRPKFRHSETGFIAFNLDDPAVTMLLLDMRSCYLGKKPEVFTLPEWHDSMVFDLCLKRSQIQTSRQLSLSDKVHDLHVWPHTPLGAFSEHNKGPVRKAKAYGG